ncbi:hypothetical protein HNP12_000232 [Aeromonas hydrophila]|uniref:phage tail tip fiber protein n=1 Tax=Aeromonas hydrophila TaxID=644 RepID=UPI0021670E5B|nr:phage tail protein [Aeromonas hydrophila]MCS3766193.1 hypothetical protein [Aeromonas hydrophila]
MTGFEIFAVIMMCASVAMSVVALAQAGKGMDMDDVGADIPDAGANKSLDFVYGRSRVQCNKVFEKVGKAAGGAWWKSGANVIGTNYVQPVQNDVKEGDWLTLVLVAGQGPFNSLKQIYINGSPALTDAWQSNASGLKDAASGTIGKDYIDQRFRDHVQIQFNMGQTPFFYKMVNDLHPEWDQTCVGEGIASIALRILRDPYKGDIQGTPQVEVEVEGRLVRDIRFENPALAYRSTAGVPGTNPALCFYDYLTSPFGANFDAADIDEYSFIQEANRLDKAKQYINGVVDQKQTVKTNVDAIKSDFFFTLVKPANKWKLISWAPDAIQESFTEDDMLDDDLNYKWSSSKATFNRLEVEYADAKKNYQRDVLVYPTLSNDELIARDGNITSKKVKVTFCTSKEQIDDVASIYYETMRKVGVLTFVGNEKAYNCEVGDIVEVSHSKYQFNKKLFRVMKKKPSTSTEKTAIAQLTLTEHSAAAFDKKHVSNQGTDYVEQPRVIPAPHNVRFEVAKVGDTYTGLLAWDRVQCFDFLEYVVEYKLSSQPETEWQHFNRTQNSELYITNLHGAMYDFRVFTRTKFMQHSTFAFLYKVDVNDDTILPKVTGLKLVTTNKDMTVTDSKDFTVVWDSMDDEPVKTDLQMLPNATGHQTVKTVKRGYEVEISHGANGEYKETVVTLEPKFTYTFEQNAKNGLNRYAQFKVRILSKGGAKSHEPAVLKAKNEQCKAPTGLEVKGSVYGITAEWIPCAEFDYQGTRIYVNANKGFVPTDADLICDEPCSYFHKADIKRQVWYVHVAHYDVFGVDELQFSPEIRISPSNVVDEMSSMKEGIAKELADAISGSNTATDTKVQAAKKELKDALAATDTKFETELNDEIKERGAAVKTVQNTVAALDTRVSNDIKQLKTVTADNTADIKETNNTLTTKDKAYTERFVKLESSTKDNAAKIEEVNNTLTEATNAQVESTKRLETSINGVSGVVQTQAKTIAQMDGDITNIQSQYTISLQAGNKFAGMSLIGKSGTVTTTSLAFAADQMLFWDPEAKNNKPFMEYRGGKLRMVNAYVDDIGAGQISAGAIGADHIRGESIEAKHIKTGSITTDKLKAENAWITNAMIGDVIQSHNFSLPQANMPPKSGWRIDKGGNVYIANLYGSGILQGAVLKSCLIETGNVIIQEGLNNVLTVTDADGWGGKRYLCREAAGLNGALSAPTNGSIAQTEFCGVVPYNYDAAGVENINGETVVRNYERTKRANVQPDINLKVQVIQASNTNAYNFNLQLIDANGNQITSVPFTLNFDWTYMQTRGTISSTGRPLEIRFSANGYNGVASLTWANPSWEQCSGSNAGDHQQTCNTYSAVMLTSISVQLTKAGAPQLPYSGNYSGCFLRCTCTTDKVGATWSFPDNPREKPPKHIITQLAMSDSNVRY